VEKKSKIPGIISAKDLPPIKSWTLPRVKGAHVVRSPFAEKDRTDADDVAVEEVEDPKPLTVESMEKIRAQAQKDGFKQGHQEGLEQGLQEGRAKGERLGYQAGLAQAKGEMDRLRGALGGLISSLQEPMGRQQQELEQALLRLVVDTAKAVVGQELATRPELMQQAINSALAALPHGESQLCFTVNVEDLALMEEIREREHGGWSVRGDGSVARGGVMVKGASSFLDFSVEKRFSQVVDQLLNQQLQVESES